MEHKENDTTQPKTTGPVKNSGGDTRGLECRHCGCKHFRVLYTRRGSGSKLIRRRQCRHCGKRMTTWERQLGM